MSIMIKKTGTDTLKISKQKEGGCMDRETYDAQIFSKKAEEFLNIK